MILTYEKNLVSRFYSFDRKLTSCLFSDKVETLTAKSPKVMYPAMIFYREVDDWSFMNTPRLVDGPKVADFFIMPINYVGKIYMEKTSECIDYAKKLVLGSIVLIES